MPLPIGMARILPAALLLVAGPATPRASQEDCGSILECPDPVSGAPHSVHALRLSGDGNVLTTLPAGICGSSIARRRSVAAPDGAGGSVVAWTEESPSGFTIKALRVDSSGTALAGWPSGGVVLCSTPGARSQLSVVPDGSGGAIAVWQDFRARAKPGLYAQRVTAAGAIAPGWDPQGMLVSSHASDPSSPAACSDGAGGVIVVWQCTAPLGSDIRAQRLAGDGAVAAGWSAPGVSVCGADSVQGAPIVAGDAQGGAIIVWEDARQGFPQLFVTRVTSGGATAPGWTAGGAAVAASSAAQRIAAATPDGSGGAYVAWVDDRAAGGDVYLQRLGADGSIAAGWPASGLGVGTAGGPQFGPALVADGSGGALIAWEDDRGGEGDVYAARVTASGGLANGWASGGTAVCAAPGEQHRALARMDGAEATVAWSLAGDEGFVTGVAGAPSVRERLSVRWVDRGPRSGLAIRLALPSADPAVVEVLDVSGRRMLRRAVNDVGAGNHVIELTGTLSWPPGVYLVRLSQSGRAIATKALLLR